MKLKNIFTVLCCLQFLVMSCQKQKQTVTPENTTDTYHGQKINDPYRSIENLESPKVKDWINQQNQISTSYLSAITKKQDLINKQNAFDKKKTFTISKLKVTKNDTHFYLKRTAKDNVPKLYYKETFDNPEVLLYDPKSFKPENNTEYVINYIQPNWDGSKIAVSLTTKGKEISEIIIINTKTKAVAPYIIGNCWPSSRGGIKWLPDNSGFIYLYHSIIDPTSKAFYKNTKSVLYKLGTDPKKYIELFSKSYNQNLNLKEEDHPTISLGNQHSNYLIANVAGVDSYWDSYYLPIDQIGSKNWKPLFTKADKIKGFLIKGDTLVYRTAKNAPNYKICSTSILAPDFENPTVLVTENKDQVITDFDITNEGIYFITSKNGVKASLHHRTITATIQEIILPQIYGNINIKAKGIQHPELWITASGWTTKNKRFEYSSGKLSEKNLNPLLHDKEFKDIIIEEIEVTAHDGKKIPLSLFYNKNLKNKGPNRVLMDGYGAYGISMKPSFSLRRMLWIQEGGIYAIAHVRGGGEKGDAWHKGGQKITKPNTWKDFISCAEYLITKNITTPKQLAIWSGSAGGILIGRSITERPDLFAAAIAEFGVFNMIRLETLPNGPNNAKEFGSLKNKEEFDALLEMDAYHHLKKGIKYPSTLLTAGINDPRLPAWMTAKFAARIQASNAGNTENLLLIDKESGHGVDDTKMRKFERFATILSFALWQTGHPDYQPNI